MTERDGEMRMAGGVARSREDIALARDPRRRLVPAVSKEAAGRLRDAGCIESPLEHLREAVARADREIALALEYAAKPHTQAEHVGALLGEMDWRSEKRRLLDNLARELSPVAEEKADIEGFGY